MSRREREYTMAKLSARCFKDEKKGDTHPDTPGWEVLEQEKDDITGSSITCYENREERAVALAFRGTEFTDIQDLKNDFKALVFDEVPSQMKSSEIFHDLMKDYADEIGYSFTNTGTSLGGSVASIMAAINNEKAIAFNAFGVKEIMGKHYPDVPESNSKNIMNINAKYDFVSKLGTQIGKAKEHYVSSMPNIPDVAEPLFASLEGPLLLAKYTRDQHRIERMVETLNNKNGEKSDSDSLAKADNNKMLSGSKSLSMNDSRDTSFTGTTGDRGTQIAGNQTTNAGGSTGSGGSSENSRGNQSSVTAGDKSTGASLSSNSSDGDKAVVGGSLGYNGSDSDSISESSGKASSASTPGKSTTGSKGTQTSGNSSTNAGGNTGSGGSSENSRGNQSASKSKGKSITGSKGTQSSGSRSTNAGGGTGPGGSCENSRGKQSAVNPNEAVSKGRSVSLSPNNEAVVGGSVGYSGSDSDSMSESSGKASSASTPGKSTTSSKGTQTSGNSSTNAGGNTGPGGSSKNSRGRQSASKSKGKSMTGSKGTQSSGRRSTNAGGGTGPGGSCENSRGKQSVANPNEAASKGPSVSSNSDNDAALGGSFGWGGGGSYGSESGGSSESGRGGYNGCSSDGHFGRPIVMDLDGDGVELVSLEDSTAYYDIDGDGTRNRIGWAGPDDGLLAYDIDDDKDISKKGEISFVDYVKGAKTDLDGLHHFDTNKDEVLDKKDKEFSKFGVWQDKNQNGITDKGEFKSLDKADISSIGLKSDNKKEVIKGNKVAGYGKFIKRNGASLKFSDIALKYTKTDVKPGTKNGDRERSSEFRSIAYRDYTGLKSTSIFNKINSTQFSANEVEIFGT
ncbi:MAG: hypothetical protein KAJ62_07265 [Desulfobacteraceae bacterium]|nr:hypothetical protein [Desulfobacteraceae bacterium]